MAALTTVFAEGTLAGRAAAGSGNNGYYYWATDTKQLFQSNGSSWTQIAAAVDQEQTLSDGATISWDLNLGNAKVTLGGNRTLAAPTNLRVGRFTVRIVQDGTGTRTVTWNAAFVWAGGTAPTLTTTAAHYDLIHFYCDGVKLYPISVVLDVH